MTPAVAFSAFFAALSPGRVIAYVAVGAVLFVIGTAAIGWYSSMDLGGIGSILHRPKPPAPRVVTQVKWLSRTKTVTVQVPVKVIEPTAPEAVKIAKEFGTLAPAPTDKLLGLWHVAKAPGDAMVTLLVDGSSRFAYVEDPEPFFAWGGPWLVGGGPSYGNGGLGGVVLAGKELFRTGAVTWQADVRGSYLGTAGWDGRVELLAVVKIQR